MSGASERIPFFLLGRPVPPPEKLPGVRVSQSVIDRGIRNFSSLLVSLLREEGAASTRGLLQVLDARVKILFLVFFVVIVSLKQTILQEGVIALFVLCLVLLSGISPARFYPKIFGFTFFFGFLVAFPATLNIITPGDILWPVTVLERPYEVWIYRIPREIGFTKQGLEALGMLCLRVMNSLSLSFLVLQTTPLSQIVAALRVFRIPAAFLLVVTLSLKCIVVFSRNVEDMYLARRSRSLSAERGGAARMWVADRMAYLFRKTERRYEEIYRAMSARGYTHDYRPARPVPVVPRDRFAAAVLLLSGLIIVLW